MSDLRIVSFLPAATEMACALGLEDQIAGITHECDSPHSVHGKPVVVRSVLPTGLMTPREIDDAVAERIRAGRSLYELDERLLRDLAPTHILTQSLCNVCAPSGNEIERAIHSLASRPKIISLSPQSLEDIHQNVLDLGEATGRIAQARSLVASMRTRLGTISESISRAATRPKVFCLEWIEPYYTAGHWVPEMIEIAGGIDSLAQPRSASKRVPWSAIENWAPEILIVMPCGFNSDIAAKQARTLIAQPCWQKVPAVRQGRVFAVDANSYFARPGPRVIEGTELLAHLIHPKLFEWRGASDAFRKVTESSWPVPRNKTCPECGAIFSCGPSAEKHSCWCSELPPLASNQISGHGCLCPECLAKRVASAGLR